MNETVHEKIRCSRNHYLGSTGSIPMDLDVCHSLAIQLNANQVQRLTNKWFNSPFIIWISVKQSGVWSIIVVRYSLIYIPRIANYLSLIIMIIDSSYCSFLIWEKAKVFFSFHNSYFIFFYCSVLMKLNWTEMES